MTSDHVELDRCPLCGNGDAVQDSIPAPNLYSEKLALILGDDEQSLLNSYGNWRCTRCALIYKRRWFNESTLRKLFTGPVAGHPKGWDAVLGRFSSSGFRRTSLEWANALGRSDQPGIRRYRRELISIIESITEPSGFDPKCATAVIDRGDLSELAAMAKAIEQSIAEPAPFRRFAGFRSRSMWEYLQTKTGGFDRYAEIGCPLWGLLPLAADSGVAVAFLERPEPNYWGPACVNAGEQCLSRLMADGGIATGQWSTSGQFPLIGIFQYLDHMNDPGAFLDELFVRAESAAVILDSGDSPVAIQHMTGWNEASMAYVAERFGKRLHTDYSEIRMSGNVLYLLTEHFG